MKKVDIKDLRDLLSAMNQGELNNLKGYLTAFHRGGSGYRPMTLQLLKVLLHHKETVTLAGAKALISPGASDTTFSKVAVRLREKIFESLSLPANLQRPGAFSGYYTMKFLARKHLTQAEILQSKGMNKEAVRRFDKVIRNCQKYELYDPLIEALMLKRNMTSLSYGIKEFMESNKEIRFYEDCRAAVEKAKYYYHIYAVKNEFKGKPEDQITELENAINELQGFYIITKSHTLYYYLYLLKVFYYDEIQKYKLIDEISREMIVRINKTPAIRMDLRIGSCHLRISDSCIRMNKHAEALKYASRAEEYFAPGSFNYLYAMEQQFNALFFAGRIEMAEFKIKQVLELTDREKTPFRHDRRMYMKACVQFLRGKYRETHTALQEINELYKDKEGWNISARILHIMNLIERQKLDTAGAVVDNMKKHINETMKMKPVTDRNILILRLLLHLANEGFSFRKTLKKRGEMLEILGSDDARYRWEKGGPELVAFHRWFMAKAERKKYQLEVTAELADQNA